MTFRGASLVSNIEYKIFLPRIHSKRVSEIAPNCHRSSFIHSGERPSHFVNSNFKIFNKKITQQSTIMGWYLEKNKTRLFTFNLFSHLNSCTIRGFLEVHSPPKQTYSSFTILLLTFQFTCCSRRS